jgi:hypothetical protein
LLLKKIRFIGVIPNPMETLRPFTFLYKLYKEQVM